MTDDVGHGGGVPGMITLTTNTSGWLLSAFPRGHLDTAGPFQLGFGDGV